MEKEKSTKRLINTVLIVVVVVILAYLFYKYAASANVVWGD